MIEVLTKGIWLGLASGSLCIGCWAILLPMMVSSGGGRMKPSLFVFLQFTLGRLVAYVAFGAFVGYIGSHVAGTGWVAKAAAVAFIPLSGVLLFQALRGGASQLCRRVESAGARWRLPFWAGLALGVSVCPPFLIETVTVLRAGSAAAGVVSFAGFFLGATIFMIPFLFFGLAGRAQFLRNLGRAACIFAALFFLYSGIAGLVGMPETSVVEVTEADIEALLPDADRFSERVEPSQGPPYREALDPKGNQIALVYLSSDICPEIRGFGGHVPLLAAVRPGRLVAVRLLKSWETPSYVTRIYSDRHLAGFRDKPVSDPFVPGRDIDAITGATVTNRAVCAEVRAVLASTVGREGAGEGGPALPVSAFVLIGGFGAAVVAYMRRLRWLRYALLAGSLLYLGFYMRGLLFSSADVVRIMFFGSSVLGAGLTWLVLVGGILITSLLFGRLFCGYLCPFGALHEFCGRVALASRIMRFHHGDTENTEENINNKKGILRDLRASVVKKEPKQLRSQTLARRLKYVKYIVLFGAPALFLATGRISDAAVEPFGTLFSFGGSALQIAFLVFVLAAGFFVMRFFCRFLCPAGAAMAILSLARIFRDRGRTNCSVCGKCIKTCPQGALSEAQSILDADYTECINCNDCKKVQQDAPCSKTSEFPPAEERGGMAQ